MFHRNARVTVHGRRLLVEPVRFGHAGRTGCGLSVRWCVIEGMAIVLGKPGVDGLSEAVGVLREWQYDGAPMQLHPGDPGWFWRLGAEATAAAVRTWSREGRILAMRPTVGSGRRRQGGSSCSVRRGTGRWRGRPVRQPGPLVAGSGRVLVGAHEHGVHRDHPVEVLIRVGLCHQRGEGPLPRAVDSPHPQPVVDASPVAEALRQMNPPRSG